QEQRREGERRARRYRQRVKDGGQDARAGGEVGGQRRREAAHGDGGRDPGGQGGHPRAAANRTQSVRHDGRPYSRPPAGYPAGTPRSGWRQAGGATSVARPCRSEVMSRPLRAAVAALAVLALLPAAPAWARHAPRPVISSVRCVRACADARTVAPGGVLRIAGRGFTRGMRAVFPVTRSGVRRSTPVRVLTRSKLSATVLVKATAGVLYVRDRAGRRSNAVRPMRVVRPVAPARPPASAAGTGVLDGNGMWIWYVAKSSGGDVQAIVAQARAHDISTVFVKSSDGTTWWPQFSADLVAALKAGGLHVC